MRAFLTETGLLQAADGGQLRDLGKYTAGAGMTLVVTTDLAAGSYTVQVDGGPAQPLAVAEPDCKTLQRLSLRTGVWRGPGDGGFVDPAADVPLANPEVFQVERVAIQPMLTGGTPAAQGK